MRAARIVASVSNDADGSGMVMGALRLQGDGEDRRTLPLPDPPSPDPEPAPPPGGAAHTTRDASKGEAPAGGRSDGAMANRPEGGTNGPEPGQEQARVSGARRPWEKAFGSGADARCSVQQVGESELLEGGA